MHHSILAFCQVVAAYLPQKKPKQINPNMNWKFNQAEDPNVNLRFKILQ